MRRNFKIFALSLSLLLAFPAVQAYALDQTGLKAFCTSPVRKVPTPGKQFNGLPADMQILEIRPGTYDLMGQGKIQVFDDNSFILTKPTNITAFMGGDELLVDANDVGGCSREQLSEVLKTNNLSLPSLPPSDFLDKPSYASAGTLAPPAVVQPAGLPSSVLKVMP